MAEDLGKCIHLRENSQPGSSMAVWGGVQSLECCALFPVVSLSVADCSGLLFLILTVEKAYELCPSFTMGLHFKTWYKLSKICLKRRGDDLQKASSEKLSEGAVC